MLKKYGDLVSGSFLLLVSIGLFTASFGIKRLSVSRIGAAFAPQIVSVLLGLLSIIIIAGSVKKLLIKGTETALAEGDGEQPKLNFNAVIATFILIMVYIAFLNSVGFLIMTAVYLFCQFTVLSSKSERKVPLFAVVAICAASAIYVLFVKVFELILPAGILG